MKKNVAVILCLIMVISCLILAACGDGGKKDLSGSKYLGTWKATYMSIKNEVGDFEDEFFLTLNADGTAEFSSADEVSKYTWEETANGFKLKGDTKMTFTDDGDGIKSKVLGVDLHFEKQQ